MYDSPPSLQHERRRPPTLESIVRTYQLSALVSFFFSAACAYALITSGALAAVVTMLGFGLLGALLMALSRGLWDLQPWALRGAQAMHGAGVLFSAVLFGWVWWAPVLLGLGLLLNGLVLVYLLGREARTAFGG